MTEILEALSDFKRRAWRCFVIPCSGRMRKEMLGFEGSGGVDGEVVLRAISWSSMTDSEEL